MHATILSTLELDRFTKLRRLSISAPSMRFNATLASQISSLRNLETFACDIARRGEQSTREEYLFLVSLTLSLSLFFTDSVFYTAVFNMDWLRELVVGHESIVYASTPFLNFP